MKVLPPYNPDAKCPKCHSEHVTTRYVAAEPKRDVWYDALPLFGIPAGDAHPEFLGRRCACCDHVWVEDIARDAAIAAEPCSCAEKYKFWGLGVLLPSTTFGNAIFALIASLDQLDKEKL